MSHYDYAIVRVVPLVHREEFINAGVILFSRPRQFLDARVHLDRDRLLALDPDCDPDAVQKHLDLVPEIAAGKGPFGRLTQSERFHWLVSPRSTIIQVSPVHSGQSEDLSAALEHIFACMVRAAE